MSQWEEIRNMARQRRIEVRARAASDSAEDLLAAAEQCTGIKRKPLRAGDPFLDGSDAMLDPVAQTIWFNSGVDPQVLAYYQIHEYGHYWIDGAHATCYTSDLDP